MSLAVATVTTAYEQRPSLITHHNLYLFKEGTHFRLYENLDAHVGDGTEATRFALWASNATEVSVIGDA